jgi:hypothetical protein
MKSINFTEKELEFLRQQYTSELANAEEYVDQIIGILKKVGTPSTTKEPVEREPKTVKRRGRKPSGKTLEKKEPKKRGRPFKVATVPTIVASLLEAKTTKRDTKKKIAPKVFKKRGRKPKSVVVEPKEPKKRGRPFKVVVPTSETKPVTVAKRGRRTRIADVPTVENASITTAKEPKKQSKKSKTLVPTSQPKKRSRRTKVSSVPTSTTKPVPTLEPKVEKKIVKKKSNFRRKRSNWGGVRLTPMSKPIKIKEPKEEPEEEPSPIVEPIVVPNEEPIVVSTQETIITPTEETKE